MDDKERDEQLDYISFWAWEYGRRGGVQIDPILMDLNEECFHYEDGWCYNICDERSQTLGLKAINYYLSSDEMLEAIFQRCFGYMYPEGFKRFARKGFGSFREKLPEYYRRMRRHDYEPDALRSTVASLEKGLHESEELFVVDFKMSMADLVTSLKYEYLKRENVEKRGHEKIKENYERMTNRFQSKLQRIRIVNHSRAAGIWLWDRVVLDGMSTYEAIKCLRQEFDLNNMGFSRVDDVTLRRLRRHANACIKQGKVLPVPD